MNPLINKTLLVLKGAPLGNKNAWKGGPRTEGQKWYDDAEERGRQERETKNPSKETWTRGFASKHVDDILKNGITGHHMGKDVHAADDIDVAHAYGQKHADANGEYAIAEFVTDLPPIPTYNRLQDPYGTRASFYHFNGVIKPEEIVGVRIYHVPGPRLRQGEIGGDILPPPALVRVVKSAVKTWYMPIV